MKGVETGVADDALNALDDGDMEKQAKALAEKLLRRLRGEPQQDARRKALAAMQRRGYSYGEASRALNAALADMDAETEE